jgi:hypothetical protein
VLGVRSFLDLTFVARLLPLNLPTFLILEVRIGFDRLLAPVLKYRSETVLALLLLDARFCNACFLFLMRNRLHVHSSVA